MDAIIDLMKGKLGKFRMKTVTVFFILFSIFFSGQVLEKYPPTQDYYEGGEDGLIKDMIRITQEKNIKKCANKNEINYPSVLVYPVQLSIS